MSENSSSFKVVNSSDVGRFIVAARNYAIGDLILEEAPLIIGSPEIELKINYREERDDDSTPVSTCVGCFKISNEFSTSCPQCNWCVCCPACADEPFHKKYECEVFKNNNIQPKGHIALGRLNIIRAYLMYKDKDNPSNWQDIAGLSSKMETQTDDFKAVLKKEIRDATKWINKVCKIEVDATVVEMIYGTFIVNGFGIDGKDENGFSYEAALLYQIGSLFSHSCCANTEWVILPTNQNGIQRWYLRIYAMRNISCNEPITIPYMRDFLTSDTAARQKTILTDFHFHCQCERCQDVSEFNFYTSALKCPFCANPTVLPDEPSNESSSWTCDVCRKCIDSSVMKSFVDDYEKSLVSLIKLNASENFKFLDSSLEVLINSADERNLSPNHRAVIRSIYYWLRCQDFKDLLPHTVESQLKFIKIMERAAKCLKMLRFFGTLRSIASLELVFAYAVASFYFKTETLCTIEYDEYSPEEKRAIVLAIYTHLKIAIEIIRCNPYNTLYSSLRDTALLRFKFWKKEAWKAFKDVQDGDEEFVDRTMSTIEFLGNGTMYAFDQVKNYLDTFWASLLGYLFSKTPCEPASMEKSVVIVIEEESVSELAVNKPDVFLLSQYDFYFSN